jgi:hypothetical protein
MKKDGGPQQRSTTPSNQDLSHPERSYFNWYFLFLFRSRKLPALAVFFLGKNLTAVLSVMARYGGMALFSLIFPVYLKRCISVVFVAPVVALSTGCVHPGIFVDFVAAY